MTPRIGSLFSGYGGLDLAAQHVFGGEVAWHCEWESAPSAILDHHWPGVPNLHDVTQVDWTTVQPIDILTGGYPCQPFSAAGKRKGTTDERHLWPYVRDAIRALRPRYAILENVAGHRSLGFDRVLGDLAEDGMHVRWTSLRASDVGAPHHRERLFILVSSPDPDHRECDGDERAPRRGQVEREATAWRCVGLPADPGYDGREGRTECDGLAAAGITTPCGCDAHRCGDCPSHAADNGCERCGEAWVGRDGSADGDHGTNWGAYAPAVRRWERLTRPAPAPTEPNKNGRPRLSAPFAEWMMGLPAGHVTGVPGISRADQLKAIGNGVCPQQAISALRSMLANTREEAA
ncbi:DNA cytosine methyltransferase [Promicromonospora sukumoe]